MINKLDGRSIGVPEDHQRPKDHYMSLIIRDGSVSLGKCALHGLLSLVKG